MAAFLDNLIFWFTLGVGWIIWLWFTSAEGQTPGKQIVGLRIVQQDSGRVLLRGEAFGRGVLKAAFDVVSVLLFYVPMLIAAGMLLSDPLRRAPWDRMLRTLVVYDPTGKTLPKPARQSLATRPQAPPGLRQPVAGRTVVQHVTRAAPQRPVATRRVENGDAFSSFVSQTPPIGDKTSVVRVRSDEPAPQQPTAGDQRVGNGEALRARADKIV